MHSIVKAAQSKLAILKLYKMPHLLKMSILIGTFKYRYIGSLFSKLAQQYNAY